MRYLLGACLAGWLAALAPPAAAQNPVPEHEEGLFAVHLSGMEPITALVLVDPRGELLLPVRAVLAHAGYEEAAAASEVLRVVRPELAWEASLVPARRLLTSGSDARVLDDAELVERRGELYLPAAYLGLLLGAEVTADWETLTVGVSRPDPFPAVFRAGVEQRREMLLAEQRWRARGDRDSVAFRPTSGGGTLDWWVATAPDGLETSTASARLGLGVWGGALFVDAQANRDGLVRGAGSGPGASYWRVFPGSRALSQAWVGDHLSRGFFSRHLRGVSITNAPHLEAEREPVALLRPELPPGWQYEVSQGGQLLDFSESGGATVTVPLSYGSTPVVVRMYGPSGELEVSELRYQTPVSLLHPGRWEYDLGLGRCRFGECGTHGYAGLRHGVSPGLTLGAGAESSIDSAGTVVRPFGQAIYSSGTRVTAELHAMPGAMVRGGATLFLSRLTQLSATGGYSWPEQGVSSFLSERDGRWNVDLAGSTGSVGRRWPLRSLRVQLSADGNDAGDVERWRARVGAPYRRGSVDLDYEQAGELLGELLRLRTTYAPRLRLPRAWRVPLVSGAIGGDLGDGVEWLDAGVSLQSAAGHGLAASLQWPVRLRRPTLSISYNARLGFGRLQARVADRPGRGREASVSVSGTAVFSPLGGASLVADRYGGIAGVGGRVFHDIDNDGRFGTGDEPAAGIVVRVGDRSTRSDSSGVYRAWSLTPYEVVTVSLDSVANEDPSLVTGRPAYHVRPAPNSLSRRDLPLLRTVELLGSVVAEAGVATAAGITVEITDAATGAAVRTTTFSDGTFYLSRVRPADYRLTVSRGSLAALRALAEPDSLRFRVTGSEMLVELPPVRLVAQAEPWEAAPQLPAAEPAPRPAPELPLLGRVHFAFDQAQLPPDAAAVLDEVVRQMELNPRLRVEVQGHTDSLGEAGYNLRLSEARASAVAEYLIGRGGDRARITVRGYGEERPLEPNDTESGRDANRRVEFRQVLEEAEQPDG